MDYLGELTVKVRTGRHGRWRHLEPNDIPSEPRSASLLRAVSGVIDKGNIVIFDGSGSSYCQTRVQVWHL